MAKRSHNCFSSSLSWTSILISSSLDEKTSKTVAGESRAAVRRVVLETCRKNYRIKTSVTRRAACNWLILRGGKLSLPEPGEITTFSPGMKPIMPISWGNGLVNNTIFANKQRCGTIPGTRQLT
jgi:hypothetical protein